MRKSVIEQIRKMIGRTISMCEISSLDSTKRALLVAVRELDIAESKERKKSTPVEHIPSKFPNPATSLSLIDDEIRKEMKNLGGKDHLLSE